MADHAAARPAECIVSSQLHPKLPLKSISDALQTPEFRLTPHSSEQLDPAFHRIAVPIVDAIRLACSLLALMRPRSLHCNRDTAGHEESCASSRFNHVTK